MIGSSGDRSIGSSEEFDAVYREHYRYVLGVLINAVHDRDLAEDLAQDTFLRAWRRWAEFEGRSKVRSWLVTIARNCAINHFRDINGRKRLAPGGTLHLDDELVRTDVGCEGLAEIRLAIADALAVLRPKERELILMHHVDGLTEKELAEMGIPKTAGKSTLWRTRNKMRERLWMPKRDVVVDRQDRQNA